MNSWPQTTKILQHRRSALQGRGIIRVAEWLLNRLILANTLSLPDVARRLGIHRVTAWEWVQRGRLPALRVGHRYRVPLGAVEALLHPWDVAAGSDGEWRCPARRCRAAFVSAAALAAHLITAHSGEVSGQGKR